jgi:hypothetical protein
MTKTISTHFNTEFRGLNTEFRDRGEDNGTQLSITKLSLGVRLFYSFRLEGRISIMEDQGLGSSKYSRGKY